MRAFEDGDFPFAAEWQAVVKDWMEGRYVQGAPGSSALEVTINSGTLGASNTLSVASGTVVINGSEYSLSSTNLQIDTNNAMPLRYDLIVADSTTISVEKGTEDKVAPAIPTDHVALAVVGVESDVGAIGTGDIFDSRVLFDFDIEDFSGTGGTAGQVLGTNGTDPVWVDRKTDAQVPSDVTGSRSIDTWYQNTDDRSRVVYVVPDGTYSVDVNSSQTANTILDGAAGKTMFVVGEGDYYRVVSIGASAVDDWVEQGL